MSQYLVNLKEAIYVQLMLLFLFIVGSIIRFVDEASYSAIVVSCSVYAFLFCCFYLQNLSDILRESNDVKTFFKCFCKNLTFSKF